ncbi:hypothetical protein SLEP1_g24493 [Rubroshorea leprosula]|uniref:Uncharacterized protein n=1 Tax=Rubroshorea leprosula TaxID=152421 RepID=A0AAV5JFV3_9ROSI|nr:hypothetical protein SLEP1_g24493 [Rubroshorea leprosula]
MAVNPSASSSIPTFAFGSVSVFASGSVSVSVFDCVLISAFGFVSIYASGSVSISASSGSSIDDAGILLSPFEPELFDIFYLPLNADGKFVGGKVVLPLGLTKVFCDLDKVSWVISSCDVDEIKEIYKKNLIDPQVFLPQHLVGRAAFQCLPPDISKILAEKVEKVAGKSKGVVPQGAPLVVRRSKRLKSASFKAASAGGSDKDVVEGCVIEVDKEAPSSFVFPDDELQQFSSEGRLLISSFMDFIAGKSFSKPLTRLPLKDVVHPGYDIDLKGPSIIGHSSIARESSKSMLLAGDKKLLSNFPLEALHDMVVHHSASVCAVLQHMKEILLDKEDSSYCSAADLSKMQERSKDLLNLCSQLHSEKTTLGANSIEVERLKKELTMLQECYDLLKKEKELFSFSTAVEKASLESFVLAFQRWLGDLSSANSTLERSISDLKLIKMLLPCHGLIVSDHLPKFEDMDIAALIHADPKLKRTYYRGPSAIFLDDSPRGSSVDAEVSQGASPSSPT